MAEINLSSVTNIQGSSHTCTSCSNSETTGQVQGANGNFFTQFNKSIKDGAAYQGGKYLPADGKILPYQKISQLTSELNSGLNLSLQGEQFRLTTSKLSSDIQTHQQVPPNLGLSNELPVDSLIDPLAEEVNADLFATPQRFSSEINTKELSLDVLNQFLDRQSELDVKSLDIQTIGEQVAKISDNLVNITQSNIQQFNELDPRQFNQSVSLFKPSTIQSTQLENFSLNQYLGLDKQQITESRSLANDGSISSNQHQTRGESTAVLDKLQDLFAKNNINHNTFENIIQHKSSEAEKLNHHLSFIKPESGTTSINLSNTADSYTNLNSSISLVKTTETPLPIIVKQGATFEHNTQQIEQSIGQNIKWLLSNKVQNANINVYPESLGQVNIALNLDESNLKISFIATTNATKELLEAGISNLRSQFNEGGINLQEVNIDTRFSSQNESLSKFSSQNSQNFNQNNEISNILNNESDSFESISPRTIQNIHLLDAYA